MQFEIFGEISDIETFATGSGIREEPGCGEFTDVVAGVNAMASPAFDSPVALSIWLKYTGTKSPVSARKEFKIKHLL
jgi:hypothetical protein